MRTNSITIELNEYQVRNLYELLELVTNHLPPLATGDWAWEVKYMLVNDGVAPSGKANTMVEQQMEQVVGWIHRIHPRDPRGRIRGIK